MRGHGTAWLFIGALMASVKVRSHKAAGRSHKHINAHIHTQYIYTEDTFREGLATLAVAAEAALSDERSGSAAPSTPHLLESETSRSVTYRTHTRIFFEGLK